MDNDTSKPAVYRRLKIISENSLDSALSDASKVSDGKEEDEEDDDEDDDESSRAGLSESKQIKAEPEVEAEEATEETEEKVKEEMDDDSERILNIQNESKSVKTQDKMELNVEKEVTEIREDTSDSQMQEAGGTKEPNEDQEIIKEQIIQGDTTEPDQVIGQLSVKEDDPKSQSRQGEDSALPSEHPSEAVVVQAEPQEAEKAPANNDQPGESVIDAAASSDTPEASLPSDATAASVEPSVVGTPSQDEEEGASDVESERSQEHQLSSLDISGMAARLLESWKDLKVSLKRSSLKPLVCFLFDF